MAATCASPYGDEISQGELSRVGRFEVTLESVGNPDHGQYPDASLPGVACGRCAVTSLKEAAAKCREFIDENDLGGGNWSGGDVYEEGTLVARVSYNGRVWRPSDTRVEDRKTNRELSGDDCDGAVDTPDDIDEVPERGMPLDGDMNEILQPTKLPVDRERALQNAAESFWGAVCDEFPEMKSGDSQLSGEDVAALAIWRDGDPGDRPVQNGAFDVEWVRDERIEDALQHGIAAAGKVLFDSEVPPPPKQVIEQLNGCLRHVMYYNEPEANTGCRP